MQSFEKFSQSIIPVYPVQEYLDWYNKQDQWTFKLNFEMWKIVHKEHIDKILLIIGDGLDGNDLE